MHARLIVAATVGALTLLAIGAGEASARARLADRLDAADAGPRLEFAGASALLAVATGRVPLTATIDADEVAARLADRVGEHADARVAGAELAEGALGLTLVVGSRGFPATAWVTLDAADAGIVATVLSIEAGGLQLPPSLLLGDHTSVTIDDPLAVGCDAAGIQHVRIDPDGIHLDFTATASTLDCLPSEDS